MSLLDKIKQESKNPKVKVTPREDQLINEGKPTINEEKQEQDMISSLEKELANLPSIVNKKMGVRLEEDIYNDIRKFCQDNDITLETLVEAYFTICQNDPDLLEKVIANAQHRVKQRTKAGNIRSLLTKTRNIRGNFK